MNRSIDLKAQAAASTARAIPKISMPSDAERLKTSELKQTAGSVDSDPIH
jgi:hypothetical protein